MGNPVATLCGNDLGQSLKGDTTLTAASEDGVLKRLEEICGQRGGRNIERMVANASGGLATAARSLVDHASPNVAILTGCFIPKGEPPSAETDGPVGAAMLAAGLSALGTPVRIVSDTNCTQAVMSAVQALPNSSVGVGELPSDAVSFDDILWLSEIGSELNGGTQGALLSHVIAIERLGPTSDRTIRSARGEERGAVSGQIHQLFENTDAITIAIGDGGNELGMGNIPHYLVKEDIDYGDLIHCRVRCDHLLVAGCSNWGALALLAGVAILDSGGAQELYGLLDPGLHRKILRNVVCNGPAVDGLSGKQTFTVDGIPELVHEQVLEELRRLL